VPTAEEIFKATEKKLKRRAEILLLPFYDSIEQSSRKGRPGAGALTEKEMEWDRMMEEHRRKRKIEKEQ